MKRNIMVIISTLLLSGCSFSMPNNRECPPNAVIDWVDTVKVNDIQYISLEPGNYSSADNDRGRVLGEVTYEMDGKACTDHQMRNGDAAFLPVGTEIYEFIGYKTSFRIIADGKVYEVQDNDAAATIGELYDIEGKVQGMSVRSSYDGSHVMDLKEEHWRAFIDEFLDLQYVGFDAIYKEIENEEGTFLDIHLEDGSSVRINYWTEANVLNPGAFGNDRLLEIISLYN